MGSFINERDFLCNLILNLIEFGITKIELSKILEIKKNFESMLSQEGINMPIFISKYEIENFAYKHFTFLQVDERKEVLKISNPELAQMYLLAYRSKGKMYKYLHSSIEKTLNISTKSSTEI